MIPREPSPVRIVGTILGIVLVAVAVTGLLGAALARFNAALAWLLQ